MDNSYNSVFFLSLAGMVFGFFGVIIRYALKSKCENVNLCWGLISVDRNTNGELKEEKLEIENGIDPFANSNQSNSIIYAGN